MALQLRRNVSTKVRTISTLIAVFALVMQPTYGLVASQVANAVASAPITNEAQLRSAAEDASITTLNIKASFDVTSKITFLNRNVYIDGNGNTLKFVGDTSYWQGNFILQAYYNTMTVKNLNFDGGDAAILAQAATLNLQGNVKLSNGEYGGIEVSDNGAVLNVGTANLTNGSEANTKPTAWIDEASTANATVNGPFAKTTHIGTDQEQYYLNPANTGTVATNTDNGETFSSIQAAIDDADTASGNNIKVNGGTTVEELLITKSINILGEGRGTTIIKAPVSFTKGGDLINISGSGVVVNLSNLSIDGLSNGYKSAGAGIHVLGGAHVNIDNLDVNNVRKNPTTTAHLYAIHVGGSSAGTATVINSTIADYQRGGIYVIGAGSFAEITNNIITASTSSPSLQNGISVQYDANAVIKDNIITGNSYGGENWSGSGITIWDGATNQTKISGNTVTNNQVGLGLHTYDDSVLENLDVSLITGNQTDARKEAAASWPDPDEKYYTDISSYENNQIVMHDGKAKVVGWNLLQEIDAPNFAITNPANEAVINGTETIEATITDESDITKVLMTVKLKTGKNKTYVWEQGKNNNSLAQDGDKYSAAIDTNLLADGENYVVLRATDGGGTTRYWNNNSANRQHVFYVDNTAPTASITTASQTSKDTVTLTKGAVNDENLNYYYCWLTTNNTVTVDGHTYTPGQEVKLNNDTTSTRDANCNTKWASGQKSLSGKLGSFNVKSFPSGEYTVNLIAVDKAKNKSVASTKVVTIDHTNPSGSVETIGGKSYSTSSTTVKLDDGKLIVTGIAEDDNAMNRIGVQLVKPGISGDVQYVFANENKLYGKTGQIDWTAEFNSSKLPDLADGQYAVNIYYVDKVGNVMTQKVFFTLNNSEVQVNTENFNTHSGDDYKGLNVGFNISNFSSVSGVSVDLYNGFELLTTNTHNQELLDLIASGTTQLSTPFITVAGDYTEKFWNLGSYGWVNNSPQPTRAVVTVTGTDARGDVKTAIATANSLAEPNNWTFASILPKEVPPANVPAPASRPAAVSAGQSEGGNSQPNLIGLTGVNSLGNGPLALNFANIADTTDTTDATADDEGETLGVSDKKSSTDNKGDVLAATDDKSGCGKFLGLCWYWWIPIAVAVLGAIWFYLASRRESDPDPFSGPARRQ